jgi:hypothetical protein
LLVRLQRLKLFIRHVAVAGSCAQGRSPNHAGNLGAGALIKSPVHAYVQPGLQMLAKAPVLKLSRPSLSGTFNA